MNRIPVDCNALTFVHIETIEKLERLNRDDQNSPMVPASRDGVPVWTVQALVTSATEKPDTIEVTIPLAAKPDLPKLAEIEFGALTARMWSMGDRAGISFSATNVRAKGAVASTNGKAEKAPANA